MKPVKFKYKGKTYKLSPLGLALIIAVIALVICLIFFGVGQMMKGKGISDGDVQASASADASSAPLDVAEYDGTVLAETEDAGSDYIKSTLFLGDSNTARFYKVADTDGKTFSDTDNTIGVVGMGIDAISSLKCMQFSTGTFTMPESVKILQPERVIITFGTNNLSGTSTDASNFIERYTAQIKNIVAAYPSVDIIVNAIPPIGQKNSYPNLSMVQINAYNKAIAQMCKDNDWKYLNSSETLIDTSTGYAKSGYTVDDGLHLSVKGLEALFTYFRTHSYITDDDRPKPLNTIPTVIGTVENLIQTNPLNDEEFTEDPSTTTSSCANGWMNGTECVCNDNYTMVDGACVYSAPAATTETQTQTPTQTVTPSCSGHGTWDSVNNVCSCESGYTANGEACVLSSPDSGSSGSSESTSGEASKEPGASEGSGTGSGDSSGNGSGGSSGSTDTEQKKEAVPESSKPTE